VVLVGNRKGKFATGFRIEAIIWEITVTGMVCLPNEKNRKFVFWCWNPEPHVQAALFYQIGNTEMKKHVQAAWLG
jgi:hypothetical protein